MADGFAMLEHDHREVGELFDDYEQRGDPDLARQICFEVTVHGEIVEQVVYPELREFGDKTSELSDQAEDTHEDIVRTIGRIELAEPDDLFDLVQSLRTTVEEHVREEEESIFPAMRELGVDAEKLGARSGSGQGRGRLTEQGNRRLTPLVARAARAVGVCALACLCVFTVVVGAPAARAETLRISVFGDSVLLGAAGAIQSTLAGHNVSVDAHENLSLLGALGTLQAARPDNRRRRRARPRVQRRARSRHLARPGRPGDGDPRRRAEGDLARPEQLAERAGRDERAAGGGGAAVPEPRVRRLERDRRRAPRRGLRRRCPPHARRAGG